VKVTRTLPVATPVAVAVEAGAGASVGAGVEPGGEIEADPDLRVTLHRGQGPQDEAIKSRKGLCLDQFPNHALGHAPARVLFLVRGYARAGLRPYLHAVARLLAVATVALAILARVLIPALALVPDLAPYLVVRAVAATLALDHPQLSVSGRQAIRAPDHDQDHTHARVRLPIPRHARTAKMRRSRGLRLRLHRANAHQVQDLAGRKARGQDSPNGAEDEDEEAGPGELLLGAEIAGEMEAEIVGGRGETLVAIALVVGVGAGVGEWCSNRPRWNESEVKAHGQRERG